MRHLTAAIVVLGAIVSGMFLYTFDLDAAANNGFGLHFTNLIWGLYYGIGFEPGFVWYKIHGPYPVGFFDAFGMLFYPLIASAMLYVIVLRLSERSAPRMLFLALGLSFLVVVPLPNLPEGYMWLLPLWAYGAMGEPP